MLDLNAIKEREEAATPGPWCAEGGDVSCQCVSRDYPPYEEICEREDLSIEDAQFIAHAREDIPALISEVETLLQVIRDREETNRELATKLEEVTKERNEFDASWAIERDAHWAAEEELKASRAEVERLRKELDKVPKCGHGDDCLLCAMKDTVALKALGIDPKEWIAQSLQTQTQPKGDR